MGDIWQGLETFFFFALMHVAPQFPDWGLNPYPLHRKHVVLTTGPPGKSLETFFDCHDLGGHLARSGDIF